MGIWMLAYLYWHSYAWYHYHRPIPSNSFTRRILDLSPVHKSLYNGEAIACPGRVFSIMGSASCSPAALRLPATCPLQADRLNPTIFPMQVYFLWQGFLCLQLAKTTVLARKQTFKHSLIHFTLPCHHSHATSTSRQRTGNNININVTTTLNSNSAYPILFPVQFSNHYL